MTQPPFSRTKLLFWQSPELVIVSKRRTNKKYDLRLRRIRKATVTGYLPLVSTFGTILNSARARVVREYHKKKRRRVGCHHRHRQHRSGSHNSAHEPVLAGYTNWSIGRSRRNIVHTHDDVVLHLSNARTRGHSN